jgi:hypothetical protein
MALVSQANQLPLLSPAEANAEGKEVTLLVVHKVVEE